MTTPVTKATITKIPQTKINKTHTLWSVDAMSVGIDPQNFPAAIKVGRDILDGRVAVLNDDETQSEIRGYLYYTDVTDHENPTTLMVFAA